MTARNQHARPCNAGCAGYAGGDCERTGRGGGSKTTPKSGSLPALSLPKGGGAIRGIGEKFSANPVTGTGTMTIPINASPGRSGFGPDLALTYNSGTGNSPFGFGWSMSLPSITRKTDKGLPQYQDDQESDIFILSGAEDLMPALVYADGQWTRDVTPARPVYGNQYAIHRYRPRVDSLFARIERWVNLADPQDTFWRSITKDNITSWYGKTAESRIADPADATHVFSWLICESYDDKGNVISYEYKPVDPLEGDNMTGRRRQSEHTSCNRTGFWTTDVWPSIDDGVTTLIGAIRVAQNVFPACPLPNTTRYPPTSSTTGI